MRTALIIAVCLSVSLAASAQKQNDWGTLLDQNKVKEARALCTKMTSSSARATQVEGYKCLANVELCGKSIVNLQGDDVGGGTISGAYDPDAAEKALRHLAKGLQLEPRDMSIHKGRLHILEVQGRYADMAKALEESATIFKERDALEDWLPYITELHDSRQFRAAIGLLDVLDKHYPNSNLVVGNYGAMYLSLKEDEKALTYIKRAVELAPNDPIDNWNLARAYDFSGKDQLAAELYPKAIDLADPEQKKGMRCYYSEFVAKKLKEVDKACALQRENCEPEERTACPSQDQTTK